MIETRKDRDLLIAATECLREYMPIEHLDLWLSRPDNVMFIEDDNVGVASFQYPGFYIVHWYFQSARGRKAIELGKAMCLLLFEEHGAKVLEGLIKNHLRASAWAARQIGFKSFGCLTFEDGEVNEVLVLMKEQIK